MHKSACVSEAPPKSIILLFIISLHPDLICLPVNWQLHALAIRHRVQILAVLRVRYLHCLQITVIWNPNLAQTCWCRP